MRSVTLVLAIALVVVASASAQEDKLAGIGACFKKIVGDIKSKFGKGKGGFKAEDVSGIMKTDFTKECKLPEGMAEKFSKLTEGIKGLDIKGMMDKFKKDGAAIMKNLGTKGGKDGKDPMEMFKGFMKNLGNAAKGAKGANGGT